MRIKKSFLGAVCFLSCFATNAQTSQNQAYLIKEPETALLTRTLLVAHEKTEIFANFHMFDSTGVGLESLALMCLKARNGVKVRVVSDGMHGAKSVTLISNAALLQIISEECQSNGNRMEVQFWNPISSSITNFFSDAKLHRNHEKLMYLDSQKIAYDGDRNWQNVNFRQSEALNKIGYSYVSVDAVVKGPETEVVKNHLEEVWAMSKPISLKLVTAEDLKQVVPGVTPKDSVRYTKRSLRMGEYTIEDYEKKKALFLQSLEQLKIPLARQEAEGQLGIKWQPTEAIEFIYTQPEARMQNNDLEMTNKMIALIESAQSEVIFTTPYLYLPDIIFDAIKKVRERGIPVTLVTQKIDSKIAALGGIIKPQYRDIKRLRALGVEVYAVSTSDDLHMKTIVVDEKTFFVGTHNMDERSTYMDMESGFIIKDASLAKELKEFVLSVKAPYPKIKKSFTEKLIGLPAFLLLKIRHIEKQL